MQIDIFQDNQVLKDDIYQILSSIKDPEFPYTLGELNVINYDDIRINKVQSFIFIDVYWNPTVKHCNFAFQIVLAMRLKLSREMLGYSYTKLRILVKSGSHQQEIEINKQANDKERYRAAIENIQLYNFINSLIT